MDRYKLGEIIGDGSYGRVIKARNKESGEVVAVKRLKRKFFQWQECMSLREIKSLTRLRHSHIVKLKEVIRQNNHLYLIFEYMSENLFELINKRTNSLPEEVVRKLMRQAFDGLCFMHNEGFFHRDIKPENLLVKDEIVKLADFGLAREVASAPPYTDYVSTRWYRAPEIILRSKDYSSPVDIWAMACVMAELYLLKPLFPGRNELDELSKIWTILGTPTKSAWPDGMKLIESLKIQVPNFPGIALERIIRTASPVAISLLVQLFKYNPRERLQAEKILEHPFFREDIPQKKIQFASFTEGEAVSTNIKNEETIVNSQIRTGIRKKMNTSPFLPSSTSLHKAFPEGSLCRKTATNTNHLGSGHEEKTDINLVCDTNTQYNSREFKDQIYSLEVKVVSAAPEWHQADDVGNSKSTSQNKNVNGAPSKRVQRFNSNKAVSSNIAGSHVSKVAPFKELGNQKDLFLKGRPGLCEKVVGGLYRSTAQEFGIAKSGMENKSKETFFGPELV